MIPLLPISLYIHVPWCLKKCGYCDFTSYTSKTKIPAQQYIKHLLKDLEQDAHLMSNRVINTIFIGGGTPSLLHPTLIDKLVQNIKKKYSLSKSPEISIEVNPKTIEYQHLVQYKNSGINRISLGIQTFHSNLLKKIERTYNSEEAKYIIEKAKKTHSNINLDLMYGLPDQTLKDALLDLHHAIQYNPQHISWYQLSIEPNTIFYTKKLNLPKEDIIFKMLMNGEKILNKAGYEKYEISSYAKKNYKCQHNLNYWTFGDYIGIGCGAHGKITQNNGNIIRTIKNKNINDFLNGQYLHIKRKVSNKDKIFEYFMNCFRLYQPVKKTHFENTLHTYKHEINEKIAIAVEQGFLINKLDTWDTTKKGKMFLNSLLEIFLNE